jgi:hypothetical protein
MVIGAGAQDVIPLPPLTADLQQWRHGRRVQGISLLRGFIVDKIKPIFLGGSAELCFCRVEMARHLGGDSSRTLIIDKAWSSTFPYSPVELRVLL